MGYCRSCDGNFFETRRVIVLNLYFRMRLESVGTYSLCACGPRQKVRWDVVEKSRSRGMPKQTVAVSWQRRKLSHRLSTSRASQTNCILHHVSTTPFTTTNMVQAHFVSIQSPLQLIARPAARRAIIQSISSPRLGRRSPDSLRLLSTTTQGLRKEPIDTDE